MSDLKYPRTTRVGVTSAMAHCYNCGWEYENQHNALALAAQHADKTGHHVSTEVVRVIVYNRPDERTS